jgi:hypothetical protein
MGIRYTHFYDEFQALIDSLVNDADESQRLANLQRLYKDGLTLLTRARDEAAYDLRTRYASVDAEVLSGISRKYVNHWANRHRERNALPRLKQKRRIDLSDVMDLSGSAASPSTVTTQVF